VPLGQRTEFHGRIAEREASGYGERASEIASELAQHYSRCNDVNNGIKYLLLAGRRAYDRGASVELERHNIAALELLALLPNGAARDRLELEILLGLGFAFLGSKGWAHPETRSVYARARELGQGLGETDQLVWALFGLTNSAVMSGRMADPGSRRAAHFQLAGVFASCAEFSEAHEQLSLAGSCFDEMGSGRPIAGAGSELLLRPLLTTLTAIVALHMGFPDRARSLIKEALLTAEHGKNSYASAYARVGACLVCSLLRDPEASLGHVEALTRLAKENRAFTIYAHYYACDALLMLGKVEEAKERLSQQKTDGELSGSRWQQAELEAGARICASEGRVDDAIALLTDALSQEMSYTGVPIMRLQADLLVRRGAAVSEIETAYRGAIECARGQENRFCELEGTTSFARWLKLQGRIDEARPMLSEIYNWFAEGFDTLALKEAKALLDELNRKPRTPRATRSVDL
jgi:hypothetical protein